MSRRYSNAPLVSTVVPTYKGDFRLVRAVESVLSQNYPQIEVLVVDDNPPESLARRETQLLMQQFKDDDRVVYIQQNCSAGGAKARNVGMDAAHGAYLCLLDDDDWFMKDKLRLQVEYLDKHSSVGAVSCHFEKEGQRDSMLRKSNYTEELLTLVRAPHTSSLMLRMDLVRAMDGFDVSYSRHQDYEFLIRFFRNNTIHVLNRVLVSVDSTGNSNNADGSTLEALKKKFFKDFSDDVRRFTISDPSFYRKMYAVHYADVVFAYLRHRRLVDAIRVSFGIVGVSGLVGIRALFNRLQKFIVHHRRKVTDAS